jgi:predicted NBD/HSP70 family sugar kinase
VLVQQLRLPRSRSRRPGTGPTTGQPRLARHQRWDVARLAAEGSQQSLAEVRIAARHIGEALAALVSFVNPEVIIIGGSLAQLEETLLAGIRGVIYERALPLATRSLRIETTLLGEEAGTIGAVSLAQKRLLSPSGIANLLRAHP